MHITIRPITGYHEYRACEELQRAVWGTFGAVPHHLLLTVQRNGGLCLGAFDDAVPAAPMVGFVFGFLGRTAEGRLKHTSHMAAVLPAYRNTQIGEGLKWAQRDHVLAQGLDLITWTYDPLLSRNAYLNIAKLGGECRTYVRNVYGPVPEEPQGELPSDRFRVDWWLNAARVVTHHDKLAIPSTAKTLHALAPLANPDPLVPAALPSGDRCLIQIPAEVEMLKAADLPRARAWRYQVRTLAEAAFAAGFAITDYARDDMVGLYLLER